MQSGLRWPGLLRGMCTNVSHMFVLCSVGICDFFPVVANRTDGCTYGLWNGNLTWASGYPNNGGIGGSRNQTVAAISFLDVTIGMGLIKPAGKLYDDEPVNKRPAIYECCGQCPTPSPTPGL